MRRNLCLKSRFLNRFDAFCAPKTHQTMTDAFLKLRGAFPQYARKICAVWTDSRIFYITLWRRITRRYHRVIDAAKIGCVNIPLVTDLVQSFVFPLKSMAKNLQRNSRLILHQICSGKSPVDLQHVNVPFPYFGAVSCCPHIWWAAPCASEMSLNKVSSHTVREWSGNPPAHLQ